ncbi:hypothetical protein CYG49_01875, partial [Candidatus Saccharibacteria bacterium]
MKPRHFLIPVVVLVLIFAFIRFQNAKAASTVLVPNADVTTQWPVLGGTADSSCSGTHCTRVDEGATPNDNDYVGTGTSGTGDEVEVYELSTVGGVESASKVDVVIRGFIATVGGSVRDAVSVNLRVNGTLQTAVEIKPSSSGYTDQTVSFSGDWTQADVDSMRVELTRKVLFGTGGSPGDRDDDLRVSNVSATLTYFQVINYSQTAYRWFNHNTSYGKDTLGWWDTAWKSRRIINFDNPGATENLTNFPVLVYLDPTKVDYDKTQNGGQDIRFVDQDGAVLHHEIKTWNEADKSEVWVKIPQLDAGKNDFIYMYYDNPAATDGQNKTGVWSNGYSSVYHLEEHNPGKGGVDIYKDATANALHCDDIVDDFNKEDKIGASQSFRNAEGDWISECGNQGITTNTLTLEAWVKMASTAGEIDRFVTIHQKGVADGATIRHEGNGVLRFYFFDTGGTARSVSVSSTLSVNEWAHVAATYDGSTIRVYKNGVQVGSTAITATIRSTDD